MERFPEQFLDLMAFIEGLGFRVVFFSAFKGFGFMVLLQGSIRDQGFR